MPRRCPGTESQILVDGAAQQRPPRARRLRAVKAKAARPIWPEDLHWTVDRVATKKEMRIPAGGDVEPNLPGRVPGKIDNQRAVSDLVARRMHACKARIQNR